MPKKPRSSHLVLGSCFMCLRDILFTLGALFLCLALFSFPAEAQVTLLIPASPDINTPKQPKEKKEVPQQPKEKTPQGKQAASEARDETKAEQPAPASANEEKKADELPAINEETDVLITRMDAFAHQGFSMDRPQAFTVLSFDHTSPRKDGHLQAHRRDLLGDVEEILYKGQRAWGANVGLVRPGLYQFIMETRPWWEESLSHFEQHYVKVMMPVYGEETGWAEPAGQRFEIVPLTRPFGLLSPCAFTGRVLFEGQALPNVTVFLQRINTDGQKVPTEWHKVQVARTDTGGQFTFVPNKPGWWSCLARIEGAPLKGADGQAKPLQLGALFWFYVDSETGTAR